jgi:choline dehydrogenase-like flavoprotein
MVYNRGSIDDWDNYAQIAGDKSFTWREMLPYVFRNENFTLPNTNRDLVSSICVRSGALPQLTILV